MGFFAQHQIEELDAGRTPVQHMAELMPAAPEAEVRGKDPRRLAEEKADRAGEKWRRAAEARGEIVKEIGGPKGLEPTRYGDWEKAGRCIDF